MLIKGCVFLRSLIFFILAHLRTLAPPTGLSGPCLLCPGTLRRQATAAAWVPATAGLSPRRHRGPHYRWRPSRWSSGLPTRHLGKALVRPQRPGPVQVATSRVVTTRKPAGHRGLGLGLRNSDWQDPNICHNTCQFNKYGGRFQDWDEGHSQTRMARIGHRDGNGAVTGVYYWICNFWRADHINSEQSRWSAALRVIEKDVIRKPLLRQLWLYRDFCSVSIVLACNAQLGKKVLIEYKRFHIENQTFTAMYPWFAHGPVVYCFKSDWKGIDWYCRSHGPQTGAKNFPLSVKSHRD